MPFRILRCAVAVGLWLLSWTLGAAAQPTAELEHPRAVVVLVGTAQNPELREVLSELLGRASVELSFQQKPSFQPAVFLAENDKDASVWVFITLREGTRARLYFRGPHGQRFLLRDLELKNGLDEIGRELIGQVVDTSVSALLHSSVGISREQARAALAKEERNAAKPEQPLAKPVSKPEPEPEPEPATVSASRGKALELYAAARGAARLAGPDVPVQYGPGAELGVAFRLADSVWLRPRGVFEYYLPGRLDLEPIQADLQTIALRFGIDLRYASGAHGLAAGVAGGVDFVRIEPRSTSDPRIKLAGASADAVPITRLELRYEYALSSFRFGLGAFADLALEETHYDLSFDGSLRRLATPWRLRPGLALALGFAL